MQSTARPWTLSVWAILLALGMLVALSWTALIRQPAALIPQTMSAMDAMGGEGGSALPFGGLLFV
ncbi:MAG: hypothetical protein HY682_08230, partial [Chloroflexi bacterium]|nr:hypothetical protein [Chloroflexota bacterium]